MNMKKIKLTKGYETLVDDEDFSYLNQWKWHYDSITGYAKRHFNNGRNFYLHRFVNKTPIGFHTDHINRNKLDNRRTNLRTVTRSKNQHNMGMFKNNTSGYKGVSWSKVMNKWESYIWNDNKKIKLGYFDSITRANSVRKNAEIGIWKTTC